jgi:hypothetical protein
MSRSRKCNKCAKDKPQAGGGVRLLCGFRVWVCECCKQDVKTYRVATGQQKQKNLPK